MRGRDSMTREYDRDIQAAREEGRAKEHALREYNDRLRFDLEQMEARAKAAREEGRREMLAEIATALGSRVLEFEDHTPGRIWYRDVVGWLQIEFGGSDAAFGGSDAKRGEG